MSSLAARSPVIVRWVVMASCTASWTAAGLCLSRSAVAEEPPLVEKSLDDVLLEGLENELLEGMDLKQSATGKGGKQGSAGEKLDQPLDGEDLGMPSAEEDPLGHISQSMRMAEALMPERGKQTAAAEIQHRVVEDLTRLIEQAERQRAQQQSSQSKGQRQTARRQSVQQPKSSGGQSEGESSKPAADSTDRLGTAERARTDPEVFRGLIRDAWGHLPDRDREQMLQVSPERFLPQYELLIERYYRRLAEERSR